MGRIWWEDINFFTNEYDQAIGMRLISNSKSLNKHSNSLSPDNTTNGELPKNAGFAKTEKIFSKRQEPVLNSRNR